MLGVDTGSTEIDGFIEGLRDGPTLCVGTSLGFLLGDSDCVGLILGVRDGPIDSDGNSLGSVVGVRLKLGSILGAEKGSTDIDGDDEECDTVGNILDFKDGDMCSDGNPLGSVVGVGLSLDGSVGGALGLSDGRIDTSGPLVGFCDGGVVS
eukprot:scaffold310617_cov56-Attheya_sp.AAC.1